MIQKIYPPLPGHLDNGTWMHYNPIPVLEDNEITVPLQKGSRKSGWLNAEETSCKNDSITLLNVDNSIEHTEGNVCGIIAIPIIESTFYNDYIHVFHDLNY